MTSALVTMPHALVPKQTFAGRHEQVGVAPQDVGRVRQYAAGGAHGGASQPGPGVGTVLQRAR